MFHETENEKLRVAGEAHLGFGTHFSPTMLQARWVTGQGWSPTEAVPRAALSIDPAAMVLHYGQAVFEGLKAMNHGDAIRLFRPEKHAQRFASSAQRLCMPVLECDAFVEAALRLVSLDRAHAPKPPGCLYLRPTMIATEAALGVRAANEYFFFVIGSPSGPYFKDPKKPLRIWVERHFVRAARGGLGAAKASANYAASLLATRIAKEKGFDQVLWLDSEHHRFIEELGAGNVFCVVDGALVTPDLSDSVLEGVTRDSLMILGAELGYQVESRPLSIDELVSGVRDGRVTEMFTCGTAAVVATVGSIGIDGEELTVGDGTQGPVTHRLRGALIGILHGEAPDTHGWLVDASPVN